MSFKLYHAENTAQLKEVSCFRKKTQHPEFPHGCGAADGRHQEVEVTLDVVRLPACCPAGELHLGSGVEELWLGKNNIASVCVVHLITRMVSPGTQETSI